MFIILVLHAPRGGDLRTTYEVVQIGEAPLSRWICTEELLGP